MGRTKNIRILYSFAYQNVAVFRDDSARETAFDEVSYLGVGLFSSQDQESTQGTWLESCPFLPENHMNLGNMRCFHIDTAHDLRNKGGNITYGKLADKSSSGHPLELEVRLHGTHVTRGGRAVQQSKQASAGTGIAIQNRDTGRNCLDRRLNLACPPTTHHREQPCTRRLPPSKRPSRSSPSAS